ncbi:UNVERIFIED_CONTAM: hypothetical protein NCL1_37082 [Trichonephila clavipes]
MSRCPVDGGVSSHRRTPSSKTLFEDTTPCVSSSLVLFLEVLVMILLELDHSSRRSQMVGCQMFVSGNGEVGLMLLGDFRPPVVDKDS